MAMWLCGYSELCASRPVGGRLLMSRSQIAGWGERKFNIKWRLKLRLPHTCCFSLRTLCIFLGQVARGLWYLNPRSGFQSQSSDNDCCAFCNMVSPWPCPEFRLHTTNLQCDRELAIIRHEAGNEGASLLTLKMYMPATKGAICGPHTRLYFLTAASYRYEVRFYRNRHMAFCSVLHVGVLCLKFVVNVKTQDTCLSASSIFPCCALCCVLGFYLRFDKTIKLCVGVL